jgi:acetyl esterase/lipase
MPNPLVAFAGRRPALRGVDLDATPLPRTADAPPLHVFVARDEALRHGASLLIFPGGGYRKVELEWEGMEAARFFAEVGFVVFVVDYQLGPIPLGSMRAGSVEPSLDDAMRALHFVRSQTATADGQFGDLDPARIAVMGFSAGGHLSCCLLHSDAEDKGAQYPPVAAAVLVYPTLRNPCCWCIVGGLWVAPAGWGSCWAHEGQHRYCWANEERWQELASRLPPKVFAVTSSGDLLLPTDKHAGALIGALRAHHGLLPQAAAADAAARQQQLSGGGGGGDDTIMIEHLHHASLLAQHGFGLREFWAPQVRAWLLQALR